MKADPHLYSTEAEKYLQHFWNPHKGHKVIYREIEYTLKDILENQSTVEEDNEKVVWLQDLAWKPAIDDCDDIAMRFNAQILKDQIIFRKSDQRCLFKKPNSIDEYRDIIRQLRVLNQFKELT